MLELLEENFMCGDETKLLGYAFIILVITRDSQ